jgi:hypothetical protein
MESTPHPKASSPTPFLLREVNANIPGLVSTLLKSSVNLAFLNFNDLSINAIEILDNLGLSNSVEEQAGLLIIQALKRSVKNLLEGTQILQDKKTIKELLQKFDLDDNPTVIDENFFKNPQTTPLIIKFKTGLLEWLKTMFNETDANNYSNRFPLYYVEALYLEWAENSDRYNLLQENLNNPFQEAVDKENGWNRYRIHLQKKVQESVFAETFSLEQIYIPLRAYYLKKTDDTQKQPKKVIVDCLEELETWVNTKDKTNAIRYLSGGPGSGKSSFTKIFAAKQAQKGLYVLLIPLHQFSFKNDDLEKSLEEYAKFYAIEII